MGDSRAPPSTVGGSQPKTAVVDNAVGGINGSNSLPQMCDHDDRLNYALLLALYTLQGIPMGLSAR